MIDSELATGASLVVDRRESYEASIIHDGIYANSAVSVYGRRSIRANVICKLDDLWETSDKMGNIMAPPREGERVS